MSHIGPDPRPSSSSSSSAPQYARNRDSPPRRAAPDLPPHVAKHLDDAPRGHSVPLRLDGASGAAPSCHTRSELKPRAQGEAVAGWSNKERPPPGIDPGVGDWQCSSCSNWNWARRGECNKCGAPKRLSAAAGRGGAAGARGFHADFGYIPPARDELGGVFVGPSEGSVVPVTNKSVDGVRKPMGTAAPGAKRMGEGGGFREIDDEENERRKLRAMEVARETQERKAERRKCAFCKRFACVC
ncbi:hypothetical protein AB1Y20_013907 [Prymnesium parvum]|uniref:RanBP2-type domain-containing protein n=1 Tax=Prymnesium parvum TaxID=97485 RepID=A0AB34IGQ4_PRYPA